MFFAPFSAEHGVGKEEGHVDADGGSKGGDDAVALRIYDGSGPKIGELAGGGDGSEVVAGGIEEVSEAGDGTGEDGGPVESAGKGKDTDNKDERNDDEADHGLEYVFEHFDSFGSGFVGVVD